MNNGLKSLLILAQRSGWRHYGYREYTGEYFEPNSGEAWALLGLTAVLVVGILLWHFFSARVAARIASNSLRALFGELCRAHQLDRWERRLLNRLATARGLSSPAILFVRPESFDTGTLPEEWREQSGNLNVLGDKLFGQLNRIDATANR